MPELIITEPLQNSSELHEKAAGELAKLQKMPPTKDPVGGMVVEIEISDEGQVNLSEIARNNLKKLNGNS